MEDEGSRSLSSNKTTEKEMCNIVKITQITHDKFLNLCMWHGNIHFTHYYILLLASYFLVLHLENNQLPLNIPEYYQNILYLPYIGYTNPF